MKWGFIDKIGSVGSLLAAAACPVCFPMWAVVGSAVGLGVLSRFEGKVFLVFQSLVAVAVLGSVIAYFNHRKMLPLLARIISPALIFFGLYVFFHPVIVYSGLFGLAAGSVMNFIANHHCKKCALKVKTNEAPVHH
jgi:mercuric ion transport protein